MLESVDILFFFFFFSSILGSLWSNFSLVFNFYSCLLVFLRRNGCWVCAHVDESMLLRVSEILILAYFRSIMRMLIDLIFSCVCTCMQVYRNGKYTFSMGSGGPSFCMVRSYIGQSIHVHMHARTICGCCIDCDVAPRSYSPVSHFYVSSVYIQHHAARDWRWRYVWPRTSCRFTPRSSLLVHLSLLCFECVNDELRWDTCRLYLPCYVGSKQHLQEVGGRILSGLHGLVFRTSRYCALSLMCSFCFCMIQWQVSEWRLSKAVVVLEHRLHCCRCGRERWFCVWCEKQRSGKTFILLPCYRVCVFPWSSHFHCVIGMYRFRFFFFWWFRLSLSCTCTCTAILQDQQGLKLWNNWLNSWRKSDFELFISSTCFLLFFFVGQLWFISPCVALTMPVHSLRDRELLWLISRVATHAAPMESLLYVCVCCIEISILQCDYSDRWVYMLMI
jgi:hypothetical protein